MTQETNIEPRSRALALELMGVLADVDHYKFDRFCYNTVKRIMEELLAGNVDTFTNPELEHMAEEAECVHKCLDDAGVPRVNEVGDGLLYSLWGRVSLYGERKEMPESVKTLMGHLRAGAEMDSEGHYIGTERIIEEAADALEAAYNVVPVKITHVAVQYDGKISSLPAPNRHHNVIRKIAEENGAGVKGPNIQGFLDSTGRFLNRRDAYKVAFYNGQLNRRPGGYQGFELYSEDLW